MKSQRIPLIFTLSLIALSACVTIPQVLQGEFSTLTPATSKINHEMNQKVRWSGYIIHVINNEDKTCFEIVETEHGESLRPKKVFPKDGSRFIACKEGFLEPQAFDKRLVTITGNLVAYTQQNIGDYQYEYPVVETGLVYIWRDIPRNRYNDHGNYLHHTISHFSCRYSYRRGYCYH